MNDTTSLGRALILYDSGKFAEAIELFDEILKNEPMNDDAWSFYLSSRFSIRDFDGILEKIAQCPILIKSANLLNSIGTVYSGLEEPELAVIFFEAAVLKKPTFWTARNNLARTLLDLGRTVDSINEYELLLKDMRNAGMSEADLNYQCYKSTDPYMMTGQWEKGFKLYENRFLAPSKTVDEIKQLTERGVKRWNGQKVDSIVLIAEQGFGDSIQMMRFIPELKKRAKKIEVWTPAALDELWKTFGLTEFPEKLSDISARHYICTMSLPLIFGTKTINGAPYLRVERSEELAEALGTKVPKIGITWQGNPKNAKDYNRSVPVTAITPLLMLDTVTFVNLQKERACTLITVDPMPLVQNFMHTAQIIRELDMVIGIDSVLTHLAGALGIETHLMNRFESEWRWGHGSKSVWYDSVKIHRQLTRKDWSDPVFQILLILINRFGLSINSKVNIARFYECAGDYSKRSIILSM